MNGRLSLSAIIALSAGCLMAQSHLQNGDLIFQADGQTSFSKAISDATKEEGEKSFVHVGIIFLSGDSTVKVIEASPEKGVTLTALDEFTATMPVEVKRLPDRRIAEAAVSNALKYIGIPYDWYYLPDNGQIYCSELIFESYLTEEGEHLFEAKPMNFRRPDGTMPEFWIELYKKLGMEVPEGIPGTNPNDIYRDKRLETVEF